MQFNYPGTNGINRFEFLKCFKVGQHPCLPSHETCQFFAVSPVVAAKQSLCRTVVALSLAGLQKAEIATRERKDRKEEGKEWIRMELPHTNSPLLVFFRELCVLWRQSDDPLTSAVSPANSGWLLCNFAGCSWQMGLHSTDSDRLQFDQRT